MCIAKKGQPMYNHRKGAITMIHPFEPFFDRQSRILILGSFLRLRPAPKAFITDIRKTDSGASLRRSSVQLFRLPSKKKRFFSETTISPSGMLHVNVK